MTISTIKTTGKSVAVNFTSKAAAAKFEAFIKMFEADKAETEDALIDAIVGDISDATYEKGAKCWIIQKDQAIQAKYISSVKTGFFVRIGDNKKKVADIFKTKKLAKLSLKKEEVEEKEVDLDDSEISNMTRPETKEALMALGYKKKDFKGLKLAGLRELLKNADGEEKVDATEKEVDLDDDKTEPEYTTGDLRKAVIAYNKYRKADEDDDDLQKELKKAAKKVGFTISDTAARFALKFKKEIVRKNAK